MRIRTWIQTADFEGGLRMSGTVLVAPTFQAALVTRPDLPGVRIEDDGTRHEYGIAAAVVVVYRPGAFDAAAFTHGEPVSVDGRPGRYLTSYQLEAGQPAGPAARRWRGSTPITPGRSSPPPTSARD